MSYSEFTTTIDVRPDDIDMNQHVHHSRYFDYVLAARIDQMDRCYGMPMADFHALGLNMVIRRQEMEYKRSLVLGDEAVVTTSVSAIERRSVSVNFRIANAKGALCARGSLTAALISLETGRPQDLPESVVKAYSI